MSSRLKAYLVLVAVMLLSAGVYFASARLADDEGASGPKGEQEALDDAVPVSVQVARLGPIANVVVSTANLRARREVEVTAQVTGIVTAVLAEEGDSVRAGQVLCRIDDRRLQIDLELTRQRLAQTKIQLEATRIRAEQNEAKLRNKREELARNEDAFGQGLLAESEIAIQRHEVEDLSHELRAAQSTVREKTARMEELASEIRKVELEISQSAIKAPFSGRVTERTVELGQSVGTTETLFKVGAFTPLYADVYLPEDASRDARPGQAVMLRLGGPGAEVANGTVERVSPVVDQDTGTVKVTVRCRPPSAAFRPGAFVRVGIETHSLEEAVLIPKQSVIEEAGKTFVVLLDEGATARRAAVELGYESAGSVQVRTGLSPGEMVVTAGQGNLRDGDKTRVVEQ